MKNIVKIASAIAFAVLAAACTKLGPSKSEVEAGFKDAYTGDIPQISFVATPSGTAKFDVETASVYIEASVTVSGVNANLGEVVIGVLSAGKEDLSNAINTDMVITQDGTYDLRVNVTANQVNFLKASVSTKYGCSYSEAVKLDVSDIPFYGKIPGKWEGKVTSLAFGDEYSSTLSISLDKEDPENVCYVGNIEPYFADDGNTFDKGLNFIKGIIDNENNQIILVTGSSMNLGGRAYYAADTEGNVYKYGTLVLSKDAKTLLREDCFFTVTKDGKAEDWYAPAKYVKK
ncbi:MAG: hypothetical protein PUD85_03755 [Bacteroidales bacterium]|nr:hypothetical protein [Bacteroidales bacterium]